MAAAFLGAAAAILGQAASTCQAQPPASHAAAAIPAAYLAAYQEAGAQYGIPWTVLAGIGEAESDHGRSDAPGVHSGANAAGSGLQTYRFFEYRNGLCVCPLVFKNFSKGVRSSRGRRMSGAQGRLAHLQTGPHQSLGFRKPRLSRSKHSQCDQVFCDRRVVFSQRPLMNF